MCIYAMRRFVEACNLSRTLPQVSLAPTTLRFSSKAVRFCSKHISGHSRPFASAVVIGFPQDNTINDSLNPNHTFLRELRTIAFSMGREDPNVWAALLDLYLPENLRNPQTDLIRDVPKGQIIRDIQHVPWILEQARESLPKSLDLLSYLGMNQKRWRAVIWLIKAILGLHKGRTVARKDCKKLQAPLWPDFGTSLYDLCRFPIWADDIIKPLEHTALDHETLCEPSQPVDITSTGLGQVLQSIAFMLLQAADRPEENSESKVIMSHVFQILSLMHHIYAIPRSIYTYNREVDRCVIQRPPTLNLFSSRIFAILSDTARRARDLETISEATSLWAKHSNKRRDLSGGNLQSRLHEVNIGIWLDLVLWSCIEGGWITEAAGIATEIDRRRLDKERSWSVVRWETLKEQEIPQTNSVVNTEQGNAESRRDQITDGPALAKYSGDPSLVNVPPRTISREVILALLDGLANTANATDSFNSNTQAVSLNISTCKRLLATEGFGLENHVLNCLIVRLVEAIRFDPMKIPEKLEQILQLSPSGPKEIETSMTQISANSLVNKLGIANSALWFSLLRHNLYLFAKLDDINKTLRTFYKLQLLMDDYHSQLIKDFVEKVNVNDDWSDSAEESNSFIFLSQIPIHVLHGLLVVVTRAKLFEFGRWLLYSNEVDGPTIPPESYSQPSLQPALLHFSAATSDTQLQFQLTEKLSKPFSWPVLRALLQCQMSLGKWDSVEQLISYIRNNRRRGAWQSSDVTSIAKAILLMEKDHPAHSDSLIDAFALLQKLIAGEYNSYNASNYSLIKLTQPRMLYQLFRMFKKCPGILSNLTSPHSETVGPITSPIPIKASAFNNLVEGVVECHGSAAGKELWELWCPEFSYKGSVPREPLKVVRPNLRTLRIILQPIIDAKRDISKVQERELETPTKVEQPTQQKYEESHGHRPKKNIITDQERRQIVEWACDKFGNQFGFSPEEIRKEFPEGDWLPNFVVDNDNVAGVSSAPMSA